MVSGLVTSPCDQLLIFSGEARLMRMASKSAIVFCISNGLERNKVVLRFLLSFSTWYPVLSFFVPRDSRAHIRGTFPHKLVERSTSPYQGLEASPRPRWPWASSPRS